jgi:oligopeptide transport system permease protein
MSDLALSPHPARTSGLWADSWRRLKRNRAALAAIAVLAVIALLAIVGPMLSPYEMDAVDFDAISVPPSAAHWFGTDDLGRDLLTRTLYGGRISLLIGLVATVMSLVVGVTYGAVSGYVGGMVDGAMMRLVEILYSVPFIFLVILLMVLLDRSLVLIFVAIGAVEWLDMARIVRGQAISLKQREFVEAARVSGVRGWTMIRRHIIPNALGPVVVYATLTVPRVILTESFLSFLGLGVQPPMASWGSLISEGVDLINPIRIYWWMIVFPGAVLVSTLLALNFLGDGLRDAWDVKGN